MNGTITVTNATGGYVMDPYDLYTFDDGDVTDPTLNIEVGDTVEFYNLLPDVNVGHPLYIKTAPTTGTGDLVTTGTVTGQGGVGTGYYTLGVSWDTSTGTTVTPGTYYYQSSNCLLYTSDAADE